MSNSTEVQQVAGQGSVPALNSEIISSLVLDGDLSKMKPDQKVQYYNAFCKSLGLNALTQPFRLLKLNGKEVLYATKDCTDQLRKLYGVSITDMKTETLAGGTLYKVTVFARDANGRTDASSGVINIENLRGEALSNAFMKSESKSKRRVTLSICGLGVLDETEIESVKATQGQQFVNQTNLEDAEISYEELNNGHFEIGFVNAVKKATKSELRAIHAQNEPLKTDETFMNLLNKRKIELELEEAQAKFNNDGAAK